MKLSIVLSLWCTVAFSANSFSQGKNVSMNLENAKVKDVFRSIEGQSTYRFFYNDELSDINRVVSMNVKDSKIEDVLNELFSNTDVSYTILDNNLIVIAPKRNIQQQKVSGTVTDATTGETLIGVSVLVEGTTIGVITDAKGKYSIEAPQNAVISFSFMGYVTEKVTVTGQIMDIKLIPDVKKLEEVVVIGYGVQRKEAVTGSVASVNGNDLRSVPAANITTALQGRVAGVEMSQTDSKPGAAMQIRIRGTRSLMATNDPLIVLDGIPFAGTIGDIDPSVIKSVDILKDASATAIYGSRGANGVLLITTTKGKKGQKAAFNYNGYYGTSKIFSKFPMMSGSQYAALRTAAGLYSNTADELNTNNTDWQDLTFKTGMLTSHDLSVSGGSEKGAYNVGVGYYRNEGVVPLQNYTRYSMRTSLDEEINKYIRLGFTTNSNYAVSNSVGPNSLGVVNAALANSPLASIYNTDGTLKTTYLMANSGAQWVSTKSTLEALGDKYIDQSRTYSTYNTGFAEVKIPGIEGLKYKTTVGLNYRQNNYGNYVGQGVFSGNAGNLSTAVVTNEHTINWAVENLLTYDRTFAAKHMINVVALYSAEQTTYNKSNISAIDIPADAFQFYNMGTANQTPIVDPAQQVYQQSGLMSWMGRAMYSYDDRYMLSLTFRADASSRLAPGHKWHSYPAVSAGWNITKESFMKNLTMVDQLKLKVGYGQTSNQAINPYQTLGLLSSSPYNFGSNINAVGYYVSQLPNPSLGWEFSKTWNYGLEFGFFNHRIFGNVEYYTMKTSNVLLPISLPPTTGVGSVAVPGSLTANIGSTENKGWEVSLNGVILNNLNGWTWEVGLNIYDNRNKLTSLASGAQFDKANWWFVGYPIDVIYDYKKIGIWQANDANLTKFEPGGNVGMIKVKYYGTYNADGTPTRAIGADDQVPLRMESNYEGGFNTKVSYKGFDLSVVGAFKNGGLINSMLYGSGSYLDNLNGKANNNVNVDYWTTTNTNAKFPKPGGIGGDNPKYGSTLGYFSASYLKIRTITLGYNIPKPWIKKAGIENLRIYCIAQNPFVFFSPYKDQSGMDPETNSYANQNAAVPLGYAQRRLLTIGTNTPSTRNYLVGINLTF